MNYELKNILAEFSVAIGEQPDITIKDLISFVENKLTENNHLLFDRIQKLRDRGNDLLPSDQTFVRDLKSDITYLLNTKQLEYDTVKEQVDNISNSGWITLKSEKKIDAKGNESSASLYTDNVVEAMIGEQTMVLRATFKQLKFEIKELQRHIDFLIDTGYAIGIMNKNERDLYKNQI